MDFVLDRIDSMRRFKCLSLVHDSTLQAVAVNTEHIIGGDHLVRLLYEVCALRGNTVFISIDTGKAFTGLAILTWAFRQCIAQCVIEPGMPNQNAYVDSLNGRLRDECLNEHWFTSPHENAPAHILRGLQQELIDGQE